MLFSFFDRKKFSEPTTTRVFTTSFVMRENSPIVRVSHELDGDWTFMGVEAIEDYTKVAMLVSLGEIIKHDKSVCLVSDLKKGYEAVRANRNEKWQVSKIEYTDQELSEFGYYCATCGEYHKDLPMAYGAAVPVGYFLIPETEREKRCFLTKDQCEIDDKEYFIRGRIPLDVEGNKNMFFWNVWVKITQKDYNRVAEKWDDENRVLEPPYTGILASELEPYPHTQGLSIKVITQPVGIVPTVILEEYDHPLYFEQESGINMDRVKYFAEKLLYNH
jgi:hypothetical protein